MTTIEQRLFEVISKAKEIEIVVNPDDNIRRLRIRLPKEANRHIASAYKQSCIIREVEEERRQKNALVRSQDSAVR